MRWMARTIKVLLMGLLVFCCGVVMTAPVEAAGLPPGVIAVDGAASGANDGSSWEDAYNFLQDALADAMQDPTIQQIWVAAATYYPDECDTCGPNGTDLQSDSFDLVNQVKLYGGFLNGDVFEDRDPENNITILTGDIDQDGDAHDIDNSWHVVTADGVGGATLINGFTISDGYADGGGMDDNGAGILILDASPLIVRCTLTRNDAFNGGGIYVDVTGTAAPTFFNCSIIHNVTSWEGGAMRVEGNA